MGVPEDRLGGRHHRCRLMPASGGLGHDQAAGQYTLADDKSEVS
jgi:hypothetical protein